ncbi:MAG: hypothetical protein CMP20_04500 [Rickettsiales bacterium]|nr:hypothetical protein [Rickettsiales bacterium]
MVERLAVICNVRKNPRIVLSSDILRWVATADENALHGLFPIDEHVYNRENNLWIICARHALFAGNSKAYLHLMTFMGTEYTFSDSIEWYKKGHEAALKPLQTLLAKDWVRWLCAEHYLNMPDVTEEQRKAVYAQWPEHVRHEVWMKRWPLLVTLVTFMPPVVVCALFWYFDVDPMTHYISCIVTAAFSFSLYARITRV